MKINYLTGLTGFTCALVRLQGTLTNLNPLPAEARLFPQDDTVCVFLPERHKNPFNPVNPV